LIEEPGPTTLSVDKNNGQEGAVDMGAVGRREVLRGATVAAGAAVAGLGLATPAMADDNDSDGLTGSWKVTARSGNEETELVASFAAGGVLISYAISPAGVPFIGTWERKGTQGFVGELWAGYPVQGISTAPGPTARIRAEGQFEGGTISGDYKLTDFGANDAEVGKPIEGKFRGSRIDPPSTIS
jgi:hypothetical protein